MNYSTEERILSDDARIWQRRRPNVSHHQQPCDVHACRSQLGLSSTKPTDKPVCVRNEHAVMPCSHPDDVIAASPPPLTSFSAANDVSDDAAAANDSSAVKSMTSLLVGSMMTPRRRMRFTVSTSGNCTKPWRRASSAAATFAFCFVGPTPSNVYTSEHTNELAALTNDAYHTVHTQ